MALKIVGVYFHHARHQIVTLQINRTADGACTLVYAFNGSTVAIQAAFDDFVIEYQAGVGKNRRACGW